MMGGILYTCECCAATAPISSLVDSDDGEGLWTAKVLCLRMSLFAEGDL